MKTYDPKKLDIVFAGIHLNEGIAEGTFITITPTTGGFKMKVGADGSVTRVRVHDRTASVKFTLMQSSAVNDRLSALYEADRNAVNGQGVGGFLLQDRSGTTIQEAAKAFISDEPVVTFSGDVESREWTIALADKRGLQGSNIDD